jgi:UDP-N-acetylmuramoyl-tripeptide--D-alanyl-D-alanine ligase
MSSLTEVVAITQRGGSLGWTVAGGCAVATALGGVRWLRVAQREHYLPDSASRFALRWWRTTPANVLGVLVGLAGLVLAARWTGAAFGSAAAVALGPLGLGLRGRTSPLAWTRRLRTLAATWGLLQVVIVVVGVLTGFAAVVCAAGALAVPAIVDLACTVTGPLERRLAGRYVGRATERLRRVGPKVVAITGSYGKTSTKRYVAHLLSGSMAVVESPASFNNRAGLARAVNEQLAEGTDVFVAEMGTYGRGEITELCSWMAPDVAVITAVGPVHLERFGGEDKIVQAKSEILDRAGCCVIAVDDLRLADVAHACEAGGKRVWRVSGSVDAGGSALAQPRVSAPDVDVSVVERGEKLSVRVRGEVLVGDLSVAARPGNVACAVAVALELGVPASEIAKRLGSLRVVAHRLEAHVAPGGFVVLDDTYNANPAGARAALAALDEAAGDDGRRVVVTPGMVELGRRQADENEHFAAEVARVGADLVIVGRTNRRALVSGYAPSSRAPASLVLVGRREQAVGWVRERLGQGDVVLYENDLPDHYP